MVNISDAECIRLVNEVLAESENFKLHQVDVTNSLTVLSTEGSMFQNENLSALQRTEGKCHTEITDSTDLIRKRIV